MKLRHLLFATLFLSITQVTFSQESKERSSSTKAHSSESTGLVYQVVEQMPIFSSCGDESPDFDRKKCSKEKLKEYIYNEMEYPLVAITNGVEGTVVIRFIIREDGRITDTEIARDIGAGCGAEGKRIVESMPNFIPGKQRGKPVAVYYNLPIKFKIKAGQYDPPTFPTCKNGVVTGSCSSSALLKQFIEKNQKYPEEAKAKGIDGTVEVEVIVLKDGRITDAKIIKDIGGGCGAEALRIVNSMPLWQSGKQFGEVMDLPCLIYIPFKLETLKPSFPGCENNTSDFQRQTCTNEKTKEFIAANLQYPKEAKEKKIEGTIRVKVLIGKNGKISNPEVVFKDIGGGCGAEALRIVNSMPLWNPGKKGEVEVEMIHYFKIEFKLDSKTEKNTDR